MIALPCPGAVNNRIAVGGRKNRAGKSAQKQHDKHKSKYTLSHNNLPVLFIGQQPCYGYLHEQTTDAWRKERNMKLTNQEMELLALIRENPDAMEYALRIAESFAERSVFPRPEYPETPQSN